MPNMIRRLYRRASRLYEQRRWAGDRATLRELRAPAPGTASGAERRLRIRYRGVTYPAFVRGGTLDTQILWEVFREQGEYRLPVRVEPRVIFDIGGNIGAAAMYFAATYPDARVFSFEPLPQNAALLRRNTAVFGGRVTVVEAGLGDRPGTFTYRFSDDPANFGGGTFHGVGCDDARAIELPVTTVADVCRAHRIDAIDVMKIDTEGAEPAVLAGTPADLLARVQVILGELHGVDDWDLWRTLATTHDVGLSKRYDRTCYPFVAVRKPDAAAMRLAA